MFVWRPGPRRAKHRATSLFSDCGEMRALLEVHRSSPAFHYRPDDLGSLALATKTRNVHNFDLNAASYIFSFLAFIEVIKIIQLHLCPASV